MSLLDGLLAADSWNGSSPNGRPEENTAFGIGLGGGGGELANLFQFDKTSLKNLEADRMSGVVSDIDARHALGDDHGKSLSKGKDEGQLCLPSNAAILEPVLRLARENRWVAEWIFKLPVLAGSTPISPEMFGLSMVGEFDETLIDSFGVIDPSVPKGSKVKHVKTMNVPVSTIGDITIGYSFCQMTEKACPLAALKKEPLPPSDENEVFFGRFAFDGKKKELLLVCPCSEASVTQMVWAKLAPVACGIDGLRKRFRAMLAVPYDANYSWSNLPTKVMLSNVYEEFRDPTYIPNIDFAAGMMSFEAAKAMSPFSSSSSLSSGNGLTMETSSMEVMNLSTTMETENPFNLSTMTKAISDIEQLFKGQFSSPITLTDVYDPSSGRLVMRKTENLLTRMDRISSPEADVQFRTTVAQAYYAKYYSPVFDLPLLPGAEDVFSSTSSVTSKEPSPTPSPPAEPDSSASASLSSITMPISIPATVPVQPMPIHPSPPVVVPMKQKSHTKISGPEKRIRKAARLAPRPLPVDEGGSSGRDDETPEAKEERARKEKEAKAYAKKIRNRESAARSNARRRKHIEAVKKELAELTSQEEKLTVRKEQLMAENAQMKSNLVKAYQKELKK